MHHIEIYTKYQITTSIILTKYNTKICIIFTVNVNYLKTQELAIITILKKKNNHNQYYKMF